MYNIMPRGEARKINRIHRVMDSLLFCVTAVCSYYIVVTVLKLLRRY